MAKLSPVSRRELIRKLKSLGFAGPFHGGKHQWMRLQGLRLTIPNAHTGAIDPALIRLILLQAGITIEDWLSA
jgi:predicted RNA binding protein YcfA (HicA-like mRNA interferase family)